MGYELLLALQLFHFMMMGQPGATAHAQMKQAAAQITKPAQPVEAYGQTVKPGGFMTVEIPSGPDGKTRTEVYTAGPVHPALLKDFKAVMQKVQRQAQAEARYN
jgi:hypothetical protein